MHSEEVEFLKLFSYSPILGHPWAILMEDIYLIYIYIAFHFRFQDEIDRDVVGPRRPLRLDHKASPLHSLHPVLHLVHQLRGWRCQWLQRHSAGRDWA